MPKASIRFGTFADRFRAVSLLKGFHTDIGAKFPFDPARAEFLFKQHLLEDRIALVVDCEDKGVQGFLLGSIAEHPFGMGRIATETIWYVRQAYRGREGLKLLHRFEALAEESGCVAVTMTHLPGLSSNLETLYQNRGYQLIESHYMKMFRATI